MGQFRMIQGFRNLYDANTWQTTLSNIEANIYQVTVDNVLHTRQTTPTVPGDPIPPLEENRWYLDQFNKIFYINVGNGQDPNTKNIMIRPYYSYWGEWATQTEMTNNELFQRFTPQRNIALKYIIMPILKYNAPTITSVNLELHGSRGGWPTKKVLEVATGSGYDWTIGSNKIVLTYFKFNDYGLIANTEYTIVLKALGTFDETQHLAWGKLDLVYTDNLPTGMSQITGGGNRFAVIGAKI